MDSATRARVAEGICRREYSLLLGAGASIGSLGGNGEPLPNGPQLRDKLISEFSIHTEGQVISLSRAYAAAQRRDSQRLEQFIRGQFTNCRPDWQHLLANFEWHRIWTLNVDDVIETVYSEKHIQFNRFNWTSAFRDASRARCQIVHLHGFAKDSTNHDPMYSELVFSVQEYVAALKDPRAWHAVFVDEFAERPFIILGASLADEFDLQQALASSAAATTRGFPSVIVLKEVTELERDELSSMGLIVVESDAHSFISVLQADVEKHLTELGGLYGQRLDPQATRFLQQFVDLRQYQPYHGNNTRHFYSGYEPHWRNILDKDDARLETTEKSLVNIRKDGIPEDVQQAVHVLTGNSGTGKSTGLLRIASQLIADGLPTFQFRGEEDLDIVATIHWLNRMPGTVLIFDGCADFAHSIGKLAEECASSGTRLLVVGAERSRRQSILEQGIDHKFLHLRKEYEYKLLSDEDIDCLIDKLASRRRLGHVTRLNRSQQCQYFRKTASRRLFEGMADLEGGLGFKARIQVNFKRVESEQLKRLYAACSIAYQFGYPLPIGMSSQIAGLPAKELECLLSRDEQGLMLIGSNGVRLPHRITAALVVQSALSLEERFDAMQLLMFALAPHIDVKAIANLTRPYRLLGRLMDQDSVMRIVGPIYGRHLYEAMQEPYDWNGRYWDQRALFESRLGNDSQARSYAEHSLQIHRHPFALNTLGTVLGRIALKNGDAYTLRGAVENLRYARDERRWESSAHPYMTFFTTVINFGQTWGISAIPTQIRNAFNDWHLHASRSSVFSNPSGEGQLRTFQRDWLYLAT